MASLRPRTSIRGADLKRFRRVYIASVHLKPSRSSCWNTSSSLDCVEQALSARSLSEMNAALIHTSGAHTVLAGRTDNRRPRVSTISTRLFLLVLLPWRTKILIPRARGSTATVNIEFFGAIYEGTPRIQERSFNSKPNPCTKAVSWLVRFAECFLTP